MSHIDPERCPLCGNMNQCGIAHGWGTCWCFTRPIPDEVISQVPAEANQRACVCEACAFGRTEPSEVEVRLRALLKGPERSG